MKLIFRFLSAIVALTFSISVPAPAFAAAEKQALRTAYEPEEEMSPRTLRGNIAFSGRLNAGYSSFTSLIVNINPAVEYFVADFFSVGLDGDATLANSYTGYSLGPTFSYHFWQTENMSAFVGAMVAANSTQTSLNSGSVQSNYMSGRGKIGILYFFNPTLAFGPVLSVDHSFNANSGLGSTVDTGRLVFQLSAFL